MLKRAKKRDKEPVDLKLERAVRLKMARVHADYREAKEAALMIGVNKETYKAHENGRNGFDEVSGRIYAHSYNIPLNWLMLGENPPEWVIMGETRPSLMRIRKVPLLSWEHVESYLNKRGGGMSLLATDYIEIKASNDLGRRVFALPIEDESMVAKPATGGVSFDPGDEVVFDPDAGHNPGDFVLAKVDSQEGSIFRKYQARGQGTEGQEVFDLVPLNEDYETTRVDAANPGRVVARLIRRIQNF